jgi:hypothetical protein
MTGPIKIGCSSVPPDRLVDLMLLSPFKLELIGSVPGNMKDEYFLQRCFAHLHSHSEWFHASSELTTAVGKILHGGIAYARENLSAAGKTHPRLTQILENRSAGRPPQWKIKMGRTLQ